VNAIDRRKRACLGDRCRTTSIGVLALAVLTLLAGCGKSHINLDLVRSGDSERAVWVGVYFLSQESVLDDKDATVLSNPDGVSLGGGVIDKEVFAVYPKAEAHRIDLEDFNPEISWVLVAAGFPDAMECARQKVQVKDDKLNIAVTVGKECITLDTDR